MNERTDGLPNAPRRRGNGFCLDGPGFYVWDPDPREVLRAAAALRRGTLPRPAPRRMLWIQPQEESPAAS